ncbi:MAG: LysR family transcriptional regulator [Chroococcidiopsidaceae cyanobacterium CP_BM_ER_R8_30]|nr:LysR family transcriptional regulator [Chroococcidiopsidaceae cyanobacterium CP_BM_ER_R8_30]
MARMTLDQLQIFLAVAQHMHFTRAAETLYITQPSVSAAIQSLEEQYGVKLFHRIGRRIELTQAGRTLQQEAQKILIQVELTERGLQELNDLQQGELLLGASQTIGSYWLPYFISKYKQQYPGIRIDCTLGNTQAISTGIVTGLFDLGLVEGAVQPSVSVSLNQQIVGSDRLQIVIGQSHPWFEQAAVSANELTSTGWVMREAGSGTRQQFEQVLRQWGVDPGDLSVILELKNGEMVKAVVESGVGAAALSELILVKELRLDLLRPIQVTGLMEAPTDTNPLSRPFLLLKHRERFQTRISQAFEQLLVNNTPLV